jgi:hypothetical protein
MDPSAYLIHVFACQHTERALMHVHDGCVWSPARLNILIRVQANQQEVPSLLCQLRRQTAQPQENQVTVSDSEVGICQRMVPAVRLTGTAACLG